ncbi:MAG: hypothetical protein ABWW65_01535 [Thermoprotei archaeon]
MAVNAKQYKALESRLVIVLRLLSRYEILCNVSLEELLTYLVNPTYEDDVIELDNILYNELLLLHEAAEICFLKRRGYTISRNTIMEVYPDTYYAHLEALNIELAEADKRGEHNWIEKRCRDLKSYLNDPYLPSSLEALVYRLINRYCNRNSGIKQ